MRKIESIKVAILDIILGNTKQESTELAKASEAAVEELEADIDRLEEKLCEKEKLIRDLRNKNKEITERHEQEIQVINKKKKLEK